MVASTSTLPRLAVGDDITCLQVGSHLIDITHRMDILLPELAIPTIYDQQFPSPDGNYTVHIRYDYTNGKRTFSITDTHGERPFPVGFDTFLGWSADSRYFATNTPLLQTGFQEADIWSTADLQVMLHLNAPTVTWSPIGHQVTYEVEGGIQVTNPENQTGTTYQIPRPAGYSYMRWSPDANYIAVNSLDFSRGLDGTYVYTIVDVTTKLYFQQISAISDERDKLWYYSFWMHDSSAFLFVKVSHVHDHVQSDLLALRPETGGLTVVVPNLYIFQPTTLNPRYLAYTFRDQDKWFVETFDLETGQHTSLLTRMDALLIPPTWSPDMSWIAMLGIESNPTSAFNRAHLVVSRPDGAESHTLVDTTQDWAVLRWIDQTNWIAYATDSEAGVRLSLFDPTSGTKFPVLDQLTRDTFIGSWDVIFSPDQQMAMVGFGNLDAGYQSVHLVSLNKSPVFHLARKYIYLEMFWSPASNAVAFTSYDQMTMLSRLMVISADGTLLWDAYEYEIDKGRIQWTNCQPPH